MTYRGIEIGKVPTLSVIQDYITRKGLPLSAEKIYAHYEAMDWKTKKKQPIKTVEGIVDAWNGIRVANERKQQEWYREAMAQQVLKLMQDDTKPEPVAGKPELPYKGVKKSKIVRMVKKSEALAKVKEDMKYSKQLRDPRWLAFREFVFVVRGRKCEKCGSVEHLNIHHIRYKKNTMAWEYSVREVMVLCGKCHTELHGITTK